MHHAFLYLSLPSLHDYDETLSNFTFCGEREHTITTLFFLFLNVDTCTVLCNSTPEKFAITWRIERDGISAIKVEAARTQFLLTFSYPSPSLLLKLPCMKIRKTCLTFRTNTHHLLRFLGRVVWRGKGLYFSRPPPPPPPPPILLPDLFCTIFPQQRA